MKITLDLRDSELVGQMVKCYLEKEFGPDVIIDDIRWKRNTYFNAIYDITADVNKKK